MHSTVELLRAATFAADRHAGQKRKGERQEPYVNHVLEVAAILAETTDGEPDPVLLVAALLHDTVEDTGTIAEEITERFGAEVTSVVLEVTDDKSLPKAERKRLQIEHAPHISPRAKQVKIADKISNQRAILTSPPADWSTQRKFEYFEWGAKVVDGCRGVNPRLETLFDEINAEGLTRFRAAS